MKPVVMLLIGSAWLYAEGSGAAAGNTPKGEYVMAEEGVSTNGSYASLAMVTFSETGAVTVKEVLRTAAGVTRNQYLGTLILESANRGTLMLRSQWVDAEENTIIEERAYRVAIGQMGMQAVRRGAGTHAVALLTKATDPDHVGTYLFAEAGRDKPSCRVVMVTLDRSNNVTGMAMSAHPEPETTAFLGEFRNGENGFHDLSLTVKAEDSEGNTMTTTETYVAAFAGDRITILRTDGGPIKLIHMNR